MTIRNKLSIKVTSERARVSAITLIRLSQSDKSFPVMEKIGRSIFIDEGEFYAWLSNKAGIEVTPSDKVLTSKDLQEIYGKSYTWLWQNVKSHNLAQPFKINRNNFWIDSQLDKAEVL